jgi:hypothetical protein
MNSDERKVCGLHQDAYAYEIVKCLNEQDSKRSKCYICGRQADFIVDVTKQDHASD